MAKKPAAKPAKRVSKPAPARKAAAPENPLMDFLKQMEQTPAAVPAEMDDVAAIKEADEALGKAFHLNVKKALKQDAPTESAGAGLSLCPNCGAFVDAKADACDRCGVVLQGEDEETPADAPSVEAALEQAREIPPVKVSRPKKGKRR